MSAPTPPPSIPLEPTPLLWRAAIAFSVVLLGTTAYLAQGVLGPRGVAFFGVLCFLGVAATFSANLRAVSWRTVLAGLAIQVGLALFILKLQIGEIRPGFLLFEFLGGIVSKFLEFTDSGSQFVFGRLASREAMDQVFGEKKGFVFAFRALPTIIFVSSFFTLLYYFGVLQFVVKTTARVIMPLMGTSGAETLSSAANVFMGQTEAPLIVKPYVVTMTRSELLALMVGGMATVSGGIMGVYLSLGGNAVGILATSVMAAPCGLYLSKLLLPETEEPVTRGTVKVAVERPHVNAIDAIAAGTSDGLHLALNVAAMLITFLAFIALINYVLGWAYPGLSLEGIFSRVFWPVAFLMGVDGADVPAVADLLGTKLVANELVAFSRMNELYLGTLSKRGRVLATYALTSFANISSIGIQLGGIGAMAPTRRPDLARLGPRALLAGFLATLVNASLAGMLLDPAEE
jgi:CNT family concentrative nucleoside transporter